MRSALITTVTGLGLLLVACGQPADTGADDPATTEGSADPGTQEQGAAADPHVDPELGAACENPRDGYRISYPTGWQVNDGAVTDPCQVFDVTPPQVEPDTVLPLVSSVLLISEPRDLEAMRDLIVDDPATDVEELREDEIAGRAALRVDGTATGEAYLDAGVEVHRTYLALDGRTLIAQASDLGEPDLEIRREIIAAMLRTIEPIEQEQQDREGDADAPSRDTDEDRVAMIADAGREARGGGDGRADLVDVRVGHHDDFARLTLEFDQAVPTFEVAPTEGPLMAFPSGEDLELSGDHYLEVVTSGTRVDLTGDEPVETYDGPLRIEGPGAPMVEVAMAGDHHGEMTWVIGMDEPADFAVAELQDPARIVIDVRRG